MFLTGISLFRVPSEDSALLASQKNFGSLSAVRTTCHPVRMLICPLFHNFNRPDACLSWSGHALNRYGNGVLKINRQDGHPPCSGRAKPYMEVTCSGRATVRTTLPHRPDMALKQERFSAKILEILVAQLSVRTAHVHRPDGTPIFNYIRPFEPQPINRGPWAL